MARVDIATAMALGIWVQFPVLSYPSSPTAAWFYCSTPRSSKTRFESAQRTALSSLEFNPTVIESVIFNYPCLLTRERNALRHGAATPAALTPYHIQCITSTFIVRRG